MKEYFERVNKKKVPPPETHSGKYGASSMKQPQRVTLQQQSAQKSSATQRPSGAHKTDTKQYLAEQKQKILIEQTIKHAAAQPHNASHMKASQLQKTMGIQQKGASVQGHTKVGHGQLMQKTPQLSHQERKRKSQQDLRQQLILQTKLKMQQMQRTEQHAISSTRPATTAARPDTTVSRHSISSTRTKTTAARHAISSVRPDTTAARHAISSRKHATSADRYTVMDSLNDSVEVINLHPLSDHPLSESDDCIIISSSPSDDE